jgi:MarR family transcriptional regulator, transcriptional regulator for hemolysin
MNRSAAPPPEDALGYLVLDITRLMTARFDTKARELGITRAQWSLIAALVRAEGSSQAGLAELMDVTPMSVGRLVDRMVRAGWVERRALASDRRRWGLYLTRKAHALRPQLRALSEATAEEALAGLAPAVRRRLLADLKTVRATLAASTGSRTK